MNQIEKDLFNKWNNSGEQDLEFPDTNKNPAFDPLANINRVINSLFRSAFFVNPAQSFEATIERVWNIAGFQLFPPQPSVDYFLLTEAGDYLLQENGSRIIL